MFSIKTINRNVILSKSSQIKKNEYYTHKKISCYVKVNTTFPTVFPPLNISSALFISENAY